jgi:hypothetical protein
MLSTTIWAKSSSWYTCRIMNYWLARNDQKLGPYSLEDLQRMAADGRALPTDWVWREGTPGWVPFGEPAAWSGSNFSPPRHPSSGIYPTVPTARYQTPPGIGFPRFALSSPSREWLKAFLAIAAIIAGGIFLLEWLVEREPFYAILSIGSLAFGLNYFWTRSRFLKK